ncbi:hypothetical protein COO09_16535 [Rhizorhabdus dicambivorans]|uniref:Cupin domain-containing protein n=1 Tax=Rhizorhabdus dicambivorans TaxID=1850238 RepID=A0A2A4FTV0_9SPHN|nr:hypothetical protein CMV14_16525 [Rhizorhabdus dicambivorans]PCE41112.1 hypothetical protein COO09_16535 [Rhizorhabdus dicambivorans]
MSPARRKREFFSARNLDDLPDEAKGAKVENVTITGFKTDEERDSLRRGSALVARHMKTASFDFEDTGMHIGIFEWAAGLSTPLHSHSDDCVYYVERGSLLMGNREIGPGEGFLTRKNEPYAFVVGPDGARIIEFTTGPRRDVTFHDRLMTAWEERMQQAVAKIEGQGDGR